MRPQGIDRRSLFALGGGLAAAVLTGCGGVKTTGGGGGGSGEGYPTSSVEVGVGYAPGGSTDLIARALTQEMTRILGQPMPVVNTPGANGVVNAKELMASKNDGYKIAILNASMFMITPLAVGDDEKVAPADVEIVKGLTQDDFILAAHPDSGWATINDLKSAGRQIRYGTTGIGTGAQLSAELTFKMTQIDSVDVPFKGDAPAMTALLGKQVECAAIQLAPAIENIRAGKLKALAIFSAKPIELLPEVPTAVDQGYDIVVSQYRTLAAPKGVAPEVKARLADACSEAVQSEAFKKFCTDNLMLPTLYEAEEVTALMEEGAAKYKQQTEQYGITLGEG